MAPMNSPGKRTDEETEKDKVGALGNVGAQPKEPPEENQVPAASGRTPSNCHWQNTEQVIGVFFFLSVPVSPSQSRFPSSLPSSCFTSPLPPREVLMSRKPPPGFCLRRICLGESRCLGGKGLLQRLTCRSSTGSTDFDHLSFAVTGLSIFANEMTTEASQMGLGQQEVRTLYFVRKDQKHLMVLRVQPSGPPVLDSTS